MRLSGKKSRINKYPLSVKALSIFVIDWKSVSRETHPKTSSMIIKSKKFWKEGSSFILLSEMVPWIKFIKFP